MLIFPAIDLYKGEVVRLLRGDYDKRTVYSNEPEKIALDFKSKGATHVHLVDLEGAKDGSTPNFDVVCRIKSGSGLFCEIGGGIRDMKTAEKYLTAGIDRIILGTAAVTDEGFLKEAVAEFGGKVSVGVDIRDGKVAIKGWLVSTENDAFSFCEKMLETEVRHIICTDISKDGAMKGTNRELYRQLSERFPLDITASGGVSTLDDVKALAELGLYGAIVGKAYYNGGINLEEAIKAAG